MAEICNKSIPHNFRYCCDGSRTDIFISEIHHELCSLMMARCRELDILNMNIASALSKEPLCKSTSNKQISQENNNEETTVKTISPENDNENVSEQNGDEEDEVCEICPACLQQAYGKVVQCGECGDWYHYDCLRIDDTTIQTLGDDDYICRMCTNNLLHLETGCGTDDNDIGETD